VREACGQDAGDDFYVCSLSCRSVVYKGMFLAEHLSAFYPDLLDERFISSFAIYHQRYSTNTFPQWRLAQPFRMLAHNGEINTVSGNINWMKSHEIKMVSDNFGHHGDDVKPVVQPSDWNQAGSAMRFMNSSGPYSAMSTSTISRPNFTMRSKSHGGQWP